MVYLMLTVIGWEKIQDGGPKYQKLSLYTISTNLGSGNSLQRSN